MAAMMDNTVSEDHMDAVLDAQEVPVQPEVPTVTAGMHQLTVSSSTPSDESAGDSGFISLEHEESMEMHITEERNMHYDMSPGLRGQMLIICNITFDSKLGVKDRQGTDRDIDAIKNVFGKLLGFEITVLKNLIASDMQSAISTMLIPGLFDRERCSCFAVVIMTHGKDDGLVYGTDDGIQLKKLMEPIRDCEELIGKPKIFIVQACRGSQIDKGRKVMMEDGGHETDGQTATIPVEADFLYVYSSAPGYVSFQNPTSGSWLISELCNVLRQYHDKEDILTMLTRVCNRLAYNRASKTPSNPKTDNLKQIPSITTTLTKILKFPRIAQRY